MARPRRSGSSPTPRQQRTARDNARARAAGYADYYDFRLHGFGQTPPGRPPPKGERARARGHRGAADLVRTLKPGDVIVVPSGLPDIEKNAKGQYKAVDVMVLRSNGRTERFTVRRRDYDGMVDLLGKIAGKGAIFSPSPSLDLRRLVRVADRPDVDDEADDDR